MSSLVQNLHISSVELVSGNSGPRESSRGSDIAISIDLSVLSGAGGAETVNFELVWSPDGVNFGSAESADTFTELTTAGVVSKVFAVKAPFYQLNWVISVPVAEVQAVTHDHTGGNFALSFDGEGPTAQLEWDAPNNSDFAEGTLTMDTKPSDSIAATGTLTIQEPLTDLDTITIDSQVYRIMDTPSQAYDIELGVDEAESKVNIILAINATGTAGVNYFAGTNVHPTVSAATFISDDALFTALVPGAASDSIVFAESFNDAGNTMNGSGTLGGNTTGTDADTVSIDGKTYTFQDVLTNVDGNVHIGSTLGESQDNLVGAVGLGPDAGTAYALAMTANAGVTMADFSIGDSIITAVTDVAVVGNAITTTETFLAGSNIFDATTLGTTSLGINGLERELDKFSNITDVSVVRNGSGDWDVTFTLGTGDRPLITFSADNLTGGSTTDVSETTAGETTTATFIANAVLQNA